jgi:excinuclease UvrABC nuclease subunit
MPRKFNPLKKITKATIKKVSKKQPGVYGIFTNSGQLQKIGRAKKGRAPKRILESADEIKKAGKQAAKFSFIETETVEEAKKLETELLRKRKRKPPFNKEMKGK